MKIKGWILAVLLLVVLLGFSFSGSGKDWLLVKVYTQDGIRFDTLFYKLRGSVIRGQGVVDKKRNIPLTDTAADFSGMRWYTAACSEFPMGSWVLVTNPVNHYKLLVQVNQRLSSNPSTKGMRLSLGEEPAALLQFETAAVNQIRVQLVDTLLTKASVLTDTSILLDVKDTAYILDTVSGYHFKKSGKNIKGIASFYSVSLDGTLTATGEKFRNEKLTAASNNLPLNTWVLVTNTKNGKTVVLRINDRMHPRMAKKGRVVDVSIRVARKLDFVEAGLTKVKVETLTIVPSPQKSTDFTQKPIAPKPDSLKNASPAIPDSGYNGLATIYPPSYKGKKTRSGEKYQPALMTAACNQVPLNSRIRVISVTSGKWVEVWVNDRIPAATDKEVVVQLSDQAGKMLNFQPKKRHLVRFLPLLSPSKNN
ncbi:MAG: septal ring lytic transglycosylase RlpA family protein [Bacteroidetes bacterium]|nr:septal ring lytic transglycosylase RlpA family protein [Bacteroidota bacterium]